MTDMIERVARALCEANESEVPGLRLSPDTIVSVGRGAGEPYWKLFIPHARAAIEAMRDVDAVGPQMLAAGKQALYGCSEDPEVEDARRCFQAMVDAALPKDQP